QEGPHLDPILTMLVLHAFGVLPYRFAFGGIVPLLVRGAILTDIKRKKPARILYACGLFIFTDKIKAVALFPPCPSGHGEKRFRLIRTGPRP
ncbi:hypothetical protein LJC36_05935, partial [Desulfovibrio sp. OttesenSCG-928-C14]|nr:hypothetical protein [Desulfovibrio sp. OttesenSCG-928-C14]